VETDPAQPNAASATPVRRVLTEGSEDDKVFSSARIMREARYEDVWKYVSLRRDVLPR
jgi:hypothetical protein